MKIVIDLEVNKAALAKLKQRGDCVIQLIDPPGDERRDLDAEHIRDADAYFCTFPPNNHAIMKKLAWIQISSAGYNQLFGLDLVGRRIRATNALGCFDVPIAEWNLAMIVNLARNFRQMIRNQDQAVWDRSAIFQNEIRGLTLGLWGYGGIGRETARLARQYGLRVHALTRNGVHPRRNVYCVSGTGDPEGVLPDRVFTAGQELEFLKDLDFLVVAMPLTKVTDGIIGERELQTLPRTAYVLNPARGPIIKEAALLKALDEKWIAGAALDTHYHYPLPPEHPLWRQPNVILTPHISGSSLSPHYMERVWDIFGTNVDRFMRGEPLLNELTADQLSGN